MKLRQDKEVDLELFDRTWNLRSVTIHPESTTNEETPPVFVLLDLDSDYEDVEHGPTAYLLRTPFFSIPKPRSWRPTVEKRLVELS